MTALSICIPTRNRQIYAMDAVTHLLQSERQEFEVLVADNSDDAEILATFCNSINDPRLKLLPPQDAPLSMLDNWERMIPETAGKWISIIGDDDYLDPDSARFSAWPEKSRRGRNQFPGVGATMSGQMFGQAAKSPRFRYRAIFGDMIKKN